MKMATNITSESAEEGSSVSVMEPENLMRLLDDATSRDSTLVIDTRPFLAYNASHIGTARNAYYPPILLRRRAGGKTTSLSLEQMVRDEELCRELVGGRYTNVVVYDEGLELRTVATPSAGGERCHEAGSVRRALESLTCEEESLMGLVLASLCKGLPEGHRKIIHSLNGQ